MLGTAVGDSESYEFWSDFLRPLEARGLTWVHLVFPMPTQASKRPWRSSSSVPCASGDGRISCSDLYGAVAAKHAPAVMAVFKTISAHTDPADVAEQ